MPSRMGQRYHRDYTEERFREMADDLAKAVTVPVNVMVEAEHRVYDLSEMKDIIGDLPHGLHRTDPERGNIGNAWYVVGIYG